MGEWVDRDDDEYDDEYEYDDDSDDDEYDDDDDDDDDAYDDVDKDADIDDDDMTMMTINYRGSCSGIESTWPIQS
jgi:hypothetical protein